LKEVELDRTLWRTDFRRGCGPVTGRTRPWDHYLNIYIYIYTYTHTRALRKVSGHFENLENLSRNLDVTWQPAGGDLAVHKGTVTLPWG